MKMKLLMERSVVRFDLEKIDFFQFEFFFIELCRFGQRLYCTSGVRNFRY